MSLQGSESLVGFPKEKINIINRFMNKLLMIVDVINCFGDKVACSSRKITSRDPALSKLDETWADEV